MSAHRVVIIGSGFGGLFATQALRREDVAITVIDRTSHHLFQPLLYQVATGILSEGQIAPSTREILTRQKNARTVVGLVEDIDTTARVVRWRHHNDQHSTPYDTLVVAAGAGQSYFGNDHFAVFAPGMKTIDDALELRSRIFGAFEMAEIEKDPKRRAALLTFVVVGAGPTGVEMAGQIRELARDTLRGEFRRINPGDARVILLDGAPHPLPPFGQGLGAKTRAALERLGVEVVMRSVVTGLDAETVTVRNLDTQEVSTIHSVCKVWAAGVQGSPLGRILAERTGAEVDRAGRVVVDKDLTVPGHPEIFVIGDLMSVPGVPGVAQGAIQSGRYVAQEIRRRLRGKEPQGPFTYRDKGSMATISRYRAVVKIRRLEVSGFVAWQMWCFLHLLYIVGFKNQFSTLMDWFFSFISGRRTERTVTNQQMVARLALETLGAGSSGRLVAGQDVLTEERHDHD